MLLSPVFERRNRGLCSDCSQGQSASLLWFPNWKTVLLDRRTVSSISKYASQHPCHALPIQHVSFNFNFILFAWTWIEGCGMCRSWCLCGDQRISQGNCSPASLSPGDWTQAVSDHRAVSAALSRTCSHRYVCYNHLLLLGRSKEGSWGHYWKANGDLSGNKQMKLSSHAQSIFLFLLGKELLPHPGRPLPLPFLCSILTLCGSGGVTQCCTLCYNEQFMEETAAQTEKVTTLLAECIGNDTPCGWLLRG